jgi:hypothetical protein
MGINKNLEYVSNFALFMLFSLIISITITVIGSRSYLSVHYFLGFIVIFLYGMIGFSFSYLTM